MRLIAYTSGESQMIGAITQETVTPIGTVAEFYATGGERREPTGEPLPVADITPVPFVPETARIFCVGINYKAHAKEAKDLGDIDEPTVPMIFGRWASTLVTDGTPVSVPPNEKGLDWEVELAVIIKDDVWNITEDEAFQHVLGYTAFNDLSARRKQTDTIQFTLGKNADRSGPIGPVLVTADELPDVTNLRVTTRVNGETVQDSNTSLLIHSIPKIIAYISDTVTLRAGDVIATGTPSGIGMSFDPPRYLNSGDEVEVEVESIGVLRTPIVERAQLEADR